MSHHNPQKIVIIGGVAGGMTTAAKAKRENPALEITVYERSGFISYSACGMPYVISGQVPTVAKLVARTPQQMHEENITVKVHHEVTAVHPESKTVTVRDLQKNTTFTDHYDRLVIATGATAKRPEVPGSDLKGIFTLRQLEDIIALRQQLDAGTKRAVIIGGGYIGLEMAEGLRAAGLQVTLIERGDRLLKTFEADMSERVTEVLERHQVSVKVNAELKAFKGATQVDAVTLANETLETDLVLFAGGASPASQLARTLGLKLWDNGAIMVNEQLQTSHPDIYAVGDVTTVFHRISKRHSWLPLGDTANQQARVLGAHLAGQSAAFKGGVGTLITKVFETGFTKTGLSLSEAKSAGFNARLVTTEDTDKASYYPDKGKLITHLIYDTATSQLLGAQLMGQVSAVKRIDVFATLLHFGATLEDITQLDLAYAPPFSNALDSVIVAANVALAAK